MLTFEEARQRLNDGKEVWFSFAKHSFRYDTKLSKNIPPTRLGDFTRPHPVNNFGTKVLISKRYYVMGKSGTVTKKNYLGFDGKKPIALYRSKEECTSAYNKMLEDAISELRDAIKDLNGGIRLFESMKLEDSTE